MSEDVVWVVSSGSYSDYSVWFVCDSKEHAEQSVARIREVEPSTDAFTESFPVQHGLPERVGVLWVGAELGADGEFVYPAREEVEVEWSFHAPGRADVSVHQTRHSFTRAVTGYRINVRGTDHERVRKAFSDKLAQVRAEVMEGSPTRT